MTDGARPTDDTPLFGQLARHAPPAKPLKRIRNPIWTERKARLIATYLRLFTFITKHGSYVDGFGGPQEPDMQDRWAANLVLRNQPPWIRSFALNDLDPRQVERLQALVAEQPHVKGRKIAVSQGDFNVVWHDMLAAARVRDKVATFCVIDQRTFQCHWETVRGLAQHKRSGNKIEIFYFLPMWWWDRAEAETGDREVIRAWWGGDGWEAFKAASRTERQQMFAQRFVSELGYARATPWPIRGAEADGRVMYSMIHATDHAEATALMQRAYHLVTKPGSQAEQLMLIELGKLEAALAKGAARRR